MALSKPKSSQHNTHKRVYIGFLTGEHKPSVIALAVSQERKESHPGLQLQHTNSSTTKKMLLPRGKKCVKINRSCFVSMSLRLCLFIWVCCFPTGPTSAVPSRSFTSRVKRPARAPILEARVARITTEFCVRLFLGRKGAQHLQGKGENA